MSKMKKALSFVLLLCMLLTLTPVSAFAEPNPACQPGEDSGDFKVHNYGEEGTESKEADFKGKGYHLDTAPNCAKRRNGVGHYECAVCGDVYYVPVPWSHTKPEGWERNEETYQASTCTTPGWEKYTCSGCGVEQTIELPLDTENGHKYELQTTLPTCDKPGQTGEICDYCHNPKPGVEPTPGEPALGHKWTDRDEDRDTADDYAETGKNGWSTDKEALKKRLPAGKDASDLEGVGPGTCKDDAKGEPGTAGKEGRVCSVCGEVQTRGTETTEHNWVRTGQTDANCVSNTIVTYTCSNCQATKNDDLYEDLLKSWKAIPGNESREDSEAPDYVKAEKATGHRFALTPEEQALLREGETYPAAYIQQPAADTEKDAAKHTLLCLNCKGETKGEDKGENSAGTPQAETKEVDCNWGAGKVTTPTCAAGGYTTYTCEECGFSVQDDVTAKDESKHDWNYGDDAESWEVVTKPSCQTHKNGTEKRTCQNPDHETAVEEWRPVKWEHTLPSDPEVNTPATCMTRGHQTFTCTVCDEKVDKELETVDHKLEKKEKLEPTCQADGYNEHWECTFDDDANWYSDENGTKIEEDSLDSYKLKKESATNQGHKFSKDPYVAEKDGTPASGSFVAEVPATCNATGTKAHYICTVCGEKKATSADEGSSFTLVDDEASLTIEKGKTAEGGDLPNNGHTYVDNTDTTPADCTHGTRSGGKVCSTCGESDPSNQPTDDGQAKGHIWERTGENGAKGEAWTNEEVLTHLNDPELAGKIENNKPIEDYNCTVAYTIVITCTDCEETNTWTIQSAGHKFERREGHEEEDFLPPTCTQNARVKEYCTNDGCTQTRNVDLYDELKASMDAHPELGPTEDDLKEYEALGHQFTVGEVEGEGWKAITKDTDAEILAKLDEEVDIYDANKLQHYRMCQREGCDELTDEEHGAPIQVEDCNAASQAGTVTEANCVEPKTTVKTCTKCTNTVTTYGEEGATIPDGLPKEPSNHKTPVSEVKEWDISGTDETNEDPFKHTHKKVCPDCEQPYDGTEESLTQSDKDTTEKFTTNPEDDEPANCSHGTIKHYECATCGFEVADEADDQDDNAHEPDLTKGENGKVYDVERTCLRNGVYHYVCKNCGVSYGHNVDPKGHKKAEGAEPVDTDDANCTEPGYNWYRCRLGADCAKAEGNQGALFKEVDPAKPAKGHTLKVTVTKSATCTDKGTSVLECTTCKKQFTKEQVNASEHIVTGANQGKGYNLAAGTEDDAIAGFTGEVDALGHSLKVVVDTEPGCETKGAQHIECTRTDCDFMADTKEALADLTFVLAESTDDDPWNPTEGESAKWTVENLKSRFDKEIPATGHTMELDIVPPTCNTPGSMTLFCVNKATCHLVDITDDDTFASLKSEPKYHWPENLNTGDPPASEDKVDFKAHTDADPSQHVYAKTQAEAQAVVADPALNENIPEDAFITSSGEIFLATNDCTHAAGTYQVCVKCGTLTVKSADEDYAALGHDWSAKEGNQSDLEALADDDWKIKPAKCGEQGEKQVTCQRCGAVEKREITALEHNYQMPAELTEKNVTPADCTNNAKTHKVCANKCGVAGDEVDLYEYYTTGDGSSEDNHEELAAKYKALGHDFTPEDSEVPNKITGSDVTGEPDNFTHTHTQHCERCKKDIETTKQSLTKDEETIDTCQKKGTQTYSCTVCGLKYTDPNSGTAWTGADAGTTMDPNKVEHTGKITTVVDVPVQHAKRNGVTHKHCNDCGKDFGYDIVDKCTSDEVKAQHTFAEDNDGWVVTEEATCTANGKRVRQCTTDKCTYREEETIESTGHKWNEKGWATPDGLRVMTACTVCGELKCLTDNHTGGEGNKKWDELTDEEKCKATVDEDGNITYTHVGEKQTLGGSEATCTDPATAALVTCETCGLDILQEEAELAPAKGHNLKWVPEVAPTCDAAGKKGHYHCETCQKDILNDPKYGQGSDVNAAFYKYSKDYASEKDLEIAPLGHQLSVAEGTKANCTTGGTVTLKCTVETCNKIFTADQVKTGEHKVEGAGEDGYRLAPGTTKDQVEGFTGTTPPLGHKLSVVETVKATCTTTGTATLKCVEVGCEATFTAEQVEGEAYKVEGAAGDGYRLEEGTTKEMVEGFTGVTEKLGHDFDAEQEGTQNGDNDGWVTDEEASCGKGGTKHRTCVREGCNTGADGGPFTETRTIDPLEHTGGEWKNDENGIAGEHWQVCANCGNEMPGTRGNHDFLGGMSGENKEATCTTPGTSSMFTCTGCGKTLPLNPDSVKPALGHELTWIPEQAATCDAPGTKGHYHCGRAECGKDILPTLENGEGEEHKDAYKYSTDYASAEDLKIEATGHSLEQVPEDPGTCQTYGHDAYWKCTNGCGKFFSENNPESVIEQIPTKSEYGPHDPVLDAEKSTVPTDGSTCGDTHKEYKCSVCQQPLPEKTEDKKGDGQHNFSMDDSEDPNYIKPNPDNPTELLHKCTKCGLWYKLDMSIIPNALRAILQERFGLLVG